jgi:hypothetical protein
MIQTPCPYCGHPEMPQPPRNYRPYGKCPKCGKKSRAVLYDIVNGPCQVKYVTTSRASEGLVPLRIRVRPDQKTRLDKIMNASETVRNALDKYWKG